MSGKRLRIRLVSLACALVLLATGAVVSYAMFDGETDTGEIDIDISQNIQVLSAEDAEAGIASSTTEGYHAFTLDVTASLSECDIDRLLTLSLYFDTEGGTRFDCPEGEIRTLSSAHGAILASAEELTDGGAEKFEVGKTLVGMGRDGESYTWSEAKLENGKITLCERISVGSQSEKIYFRVVYFINFEDNGDKIVGANDAIGYTFTCEEDI